MQRVILDHVASNCGARRVWSVMVKGGWGPTRPLAADPDALWPGGEIFFWQLLPVIYKRKNLQKIQDLSAGRAWQSMYASVRFI